MQCHNNPGKTIVFTLSNWLCVQGRTVVLLLVVRRSRVIVVRGVPSQLLCLRIKHGNNIFWEKQTSTFNPQPRERVQPPVQTYLCVQCRAGDCWDRWSRRWRLLNWFAFHRFQDPPQTTHPAFYLRRLTNSSDVGQRLLLWQSVSHMVIKKRVNLTCIEYPIRAPAGSSLYQLRDGKRQFLQIYQYNKSNKLFFFFKYKKYNTNKHPYHQTFLVLSTEYI